MAVFDKIQKVVRAPLAANWAGAKGTPVAVGLNTSGQVVPGAGNTGIVGLVLRHSDYAPKAGEIVDILSLGEAVEVSGLTAGTRITANTTSGAIGTTAASATQQVVGFAVEATRLIVHCPPLQFYGT